MPTEVIHPLDADRTFPVVRLSGVFDPATSAEVRSALLDVLADQPEGLVVDVEAIEPAAAAVLTDVAAETAEWPAARMALAVSHDRDSWLSTGLRVFPDVPAAAAALGRAHPEDRRRLDLEPVIGAARRARELVTEACASWDCPDLSGSACIVVTELANNVVAHARTPMTVLLARHDDTIHVAVRDRSATVPSFTGPVAPTSYGGRGLLLIDSISDRWGSLRLADGKVVWSLLSASPLTGAGSPQVTEAGIPDPARG